MNKIKKILVITIFASFIFSCSKISALFEPMDTDIDMFLNRVSNVQGNFISLSLSLSLTTSNMTFSSTGEKLTIVQTSVSGESTTTVYELLEFTNSTKAIYQNVAADGTTIYCGVQLTSDNVAYIYIGISISNKNLVFVQPSYEFDVPTEDEILSQDDPQVEPESLDAFLVEVKNKTAYVTILSVKHGLVFSSDGKTLTFTSAFTSGGTIKLTHESSSSSETANYKIISSDISGYTVGNTIIVTRTTVGGTFNAQPFTWN